MPADDARSESFFGEKATTEGRVACASTLSEQRAKAERLRFNGIDHRFSTN
jgi:hypothetical protein